MAADYSWSNHDPDGLVVSSGVFTLPLIATDVSSGKDDHRPNEGCHAFIVGRENALLRVLIDAVFDEPPRYNPVTLCGLTGAGKSHLLHGLADRLRTLAPHRKVWFLTGADFARLYARAIELDNLAEFHDKSAAAQVLIIDGLQELASKPAAQLELLQTIDQSLECDSPQLLFSCRLDNAGLSWMHAALRSRLEGGLTIPMALPEAATRIEMVRQLSQQFGLSLTEQTIQQVASPFPHGATTSFNQLRGAVMRLTHDSRQPQTGLAGTADCKVAANVPHSESIRHIAKLVARHFDIRMSELTSLSRRTTVVQARAVAIFLARSLLDVSFEQIGKNFGDRDHTTILHAYRKIADSLPSDPILKQTVAELSLLLRAPRTEHWKTR